jgi:hypothetical protein
MRQQLDPNQDQTPRFVFKTTDHTIKAESDHGNASIWEIRWGGEALGGKDHIGDVRVGSCWG